MERLRAAAAAVLALAAVPAWAQNDEGLYIGAGFGDFSTEIDDVGDVDIDFDEDDDASKMFAGWRFNNWFAVELDYIDFGEPGGSLDLLDLEVDAKGLAPYAMATLPLGSLELFARAGIIFYDIEVTTGLDDFDVDESGEDVVYGAGIGYTFFERLNLRAEYEVIEISELDEANAVWISAAWRF